MRLSKRSEYALRALVMLARRPASCMLQIHEISASENIPVKFLEQILLALRHGGILASRRGVRGGYGFSRKPEEVTVGEVVRLMDGPLAPVPCTVQNPTESCTCPDPDRCSLRLFMQEVRDALAALLEKRSIADMAAMSPDPEVLEFQI